MSSMNMKIKILSREQECAVLQLLAAEGYIISPVLGNHEYLYTYHDHRNVYWDNDSYSFDKHKSTEVTLEQKPIEYFFKPVTRYNFKVEGNNLFINGFKVKQEDLNNFLSNVNG